MNELDAMGVEDKDDDDHSGSFSRSDLEEKIQTTEERLTRFLSYKQQMVQSGQGQLSLTDPHAKLMKGKDGMLVGFNVQIAVDTESHLIKDFNVTTKCTDHGEIFPTLSIIRDKTKRILDSVEDKGYLQEEDMVACLENGIVPHVIPQTKPTFMNYILF